MLTRVWSVGPLLPASPLFEFRLVNRLSLFSAPSTAESLPPGRGNQVREHIRLYDYQYLSWWISKIFLIFTPDEL